MYDYKESDKTHSINELREIYKSQKFEVSLKFKLRFHKETENQFKVGQLLTIEF